MAVENAIEVSAFAAGEMEDIINLYYDGLISREQMADQVSHELLKDLIYRQDEPVMIKIFKKGGE